MNPVLRRLWPLVRGRCYLCDRRATQRFRGWNEGDDPWTMDLRACDEHADQVRELVQTRLRHAYMMEWEQKEESA